MLNFIAGSNQWIVLSLASMDQPVEPPVSAATSLVISPSKSGKPLPPHIMTSPVSWQLRALDASCVPAPFASARYQVPYAGSTTRNLKLLLGAGTAAALTLYGTFVSLRARFQRISPCFSYLIAMRAAKDMALRSIV